MPLRVLGVSAFYHDSAACLLEDGRVIAAVEEERLSRIKHDRAFPRRAIAHCLAAGGIEGKDLDAIVFYEKPLPKLERQLQTWLDVYPRSLRRWVGGLSAWLDGRLDLSRFLEDEIGPAKEILFSEHHLSHAAFAFDGSPFDEAHVLVSDGVGEWSTTSLWRASAERIEPVWDVHFPDSLGLFYSLVTAHLGFEVNEGEYKVMGLSSYGTPSMAKEMEALLPFEGERGFRLSRRHLDLARPDRLGSRALDELLGPPRRKGEPIEKRHEDLAKSAQARLEAALERLVSDVPPGAPLCLSGGVALNGLANTRLGRGRPLHVGFAPGDSGGALGAAYVGHRALSGERPKRTGPYVGPSFDGAAIDGALRRLGLSSRPLAELGGDGFVADRLASARIVGFFRGAMELGPRALGHRSILADPRDAAARDRLNLRVKQREPFRPFAPIVRLEDADRFFELERPVPWMTEIRPVREAERASIPAVVHVDGTARVQTIAANEEPRVHALLGLMGERTGVPVLVNTSFNVAGEPIVCTPEDALRCMLAARLDGLVLEDRWVEPPP